MSELTPCTVRPYILTPTLQDCVDAGKVMAAGLRPLGPRGGSVRALRLLSGCRAIALTSRGLIEVYRFNWTDAEAVSGGGGGGSSFGGVSPTCSSSGAMVALLPAAEGGSSGGG